MANKENVQDVQFEEVDDNKKEKKSLLRVIGRNIINRYKEKPLRLVYDTLTVGVPAALGVYLGKKLKRRIQ